MPFSTRAAFNLLFAAIIGLFVLVVALRKEFALTEVLKIAEMDKKRGVSD